MVQIKTATQKKRFHISCVSCGRLISSDTNDRPFQVEVRNAENETDYDKVTRCPRCRTWLGVFK